ncbi:MAG: hypothetical protein GXP60_05130 [Epsilonproteobacteria bacterium]|nr:hypothetical protein [Campylobacterota bacterium]
MSDNLTRKHKILHDSQSAVMKKPAIKRRRFSHQKGSVLIAQGAQSRRNRCNRDTFCIARHITKRKIDAWEVYTIKDEEIASYALGFKHMREQLEQENNYQEDLEIKKLTEETVTWFSQHTKQIKKSRLEFTEAMDKFNERLIKFQLTSGEEGANEKN